MSDDDGILGSQAVHAASWRLAAELVHSVGPCSVVTTYDPPGGGYDVLWIRPDSALGTGVYLNRNGSIHVMGPGHAHLDPWPGTEVWARCLTGGGIKIVLAQILAAWHHALPTSRQWASRSVLTYRVLSEVLAANSLDSHEWTVVDAARFWTAQRDPFTFDPSLRSMLNRELWQVERGCQPLAWLHEGWLWRPNGDRIDLYHRYRAGQSLGELAALVTHEGLQHSVPVPGLALELPAPDAEYEQVLQFAATYNLYERFGTTLPLDLLGKAVLGELDPSSREALELGQDAIRYWLFAEYRADYFQGGSESGEQRVRAILELLRRVAGSSVTYGPIGNEGTVL